ncbi:MAG TPA: protein kinase [Kofleriaceae bacterium]|nr:protein kinase [Kofleriaceae bacterium]
MFRTGFDCCPADGAALRPCSEGVDPLIGAEIADRYLIEDLVGEGSMGMIYRARHLRLPCKFAIKVLFGDLVADPRMRIRFAQEAALASRLSHPNVVSVVDFGRSDAGLLYLVMSYVEGEPLSDLIAREAPLDTAQAIRLTRELAQGLAHAHSQGLVHRDFKPGNVVLERNEGGTPVPRILDFGLAISMRDREGVGEEVAGRLTECGLIVGTPIYIAPEQALDHAVDHRADLFALGVTMYEMLTGRPPFDGSPVEIAHKNVTERVPPMSVRRPGLEVQPELERVVRRLLAKAPENRFASAEDLCAALDSVEWAVARADTQGMRAAIYQPDADPRASYPGFDDPTWMVNRGRSRLARIGLPALVAGVAACALSLSQGWIDVGMFDSRVPVAAAASDEEVAPTGPAAMATPAPMTERAADRVDRSRTERQAGAATPTQARAGKPARRAAASHPEERERSAEPRERIASREAEPAGATDPVPVSAAAVPPQADPGALAPVADGAALIGSEPDGADLQQTPLSIDSSASVDRLIRDYKDVGQAIAHLQARGGDQVARVFRDRYFRLPYGDALRIPAVRRDALAELAGLRHEVEDAIESLPAAPEVEQPSS